MWNILGGAPTAAYAAIGAAISVGYYKNQAASMKWNFYINNTRVFQRLVFGATLGLACGYMQFGDRQTLHNAWVAERLRRRYPESMTLNAQDLWSLKGVKTSQEFYRWQ